MKRIRKYGNFFVVLMVIAAGACAKQGSPSGGPRDTTPPVVVRSVPLNRTTNFSGKTITVTFDEFIQLDKIQEKFMISPPVEKRPDISIRGKNVIITLDAELRDSTTYTLYFQDAIRDLNEGNILENYQFVFSTGSFIDSLMLDGRVYDAINLEVPPRMMVMLHSNLSDTAPKTVIPDYISMTDQTGFFTVNNLRAGTYRIYALEDLNNNRKYDPADERFAFLSDTIRVTVESNLPFDADTLLHEQEAHIHDDDIHLHQPDSLLRVTQDTLITTIRTHKADSLLHVKQDSLLKTTVRTHEPDSLLRPEQDSLLKRPGRIHEPEYILYAFKAKQERYFLASTARREARQLEYFLSLPPDTMDFIFEAPGITSEGYFTEWSRARDTLRIWLTDSTIYNDQIIETVITYPFSDRDSGLIYKTDTIPMRFIQPRIPRGGAAPAKSLQIASDAARTGIPPGRDITIIPNSPVESADFSLVTISPFNDTTGLLLPFTPLFDPLVPRKIVIEQKLDEGVEYVLRFLPGALVSIYGETNDTTLFRFRVRTIDSYGSFAANLTGYEGRAVVQLLDTRENVVMEQRIESPGRAMFRFVENGNYRLKVIYDTDRNGVWTPGDFLKGLQPEKVSYYPEEIEIKSNWDVSQDWDISVKNFKDELLRAKPPQKR